MLKIPAGCFNLGVLLPMVSGMFRIITIMIPITLFSPTGVSDFAGALGKTLAYDLQHCKNCSEKNSLIELVLPFLVVGPTKCFGSWSWISGSLFNIT